MNIRVLFVNFFLSNNFHFKKIYLKKSCEFLPKYMTGSQLVIKTNLHKIRLLNATQHDKLVNLKTRNLSNNLTCFLFGMSALFLEKLNIICISCLYLLVFSNEQNSLQVFFLTASPHPSSSLRKE